MAYNSYNIYGTPFQMFVHEYFLHVHSVISFALYTYRPATVSTYRPPRTHQKIRKLLWQIWVEKERRTTPEPFGTEGRVRN